MEIRKNTQPVLDGDVVIELYIKPGAASSEEIAGVLDAINDWRQISGLPLLYWETDEALSKGEFRYIKGSKAMEKN